MHTCATALSDAVVRLIEKAKSCISEKRAMCDSSTLSFKGLVKELLFTHNTLISVLYAIVTKADTRYIRCCTSEGYVINKGAQFRYGVDSQYGDVIFVMKKDFWRDLKGVDFRRHIVLDYPYVGHSHKRDFIENFGDGNINLVDRWLEIDASYYDFRRPPEPGVRIGNGKECKESHWDFSWCNIQLHIGENVGLHHVEKVYAPAWIVHDNVTIAKIADSGVNATLLQRLVTNNLPNYPGGDCATNPLNGLFHLYGPPLAGDHYYKIQRDRSKIEEDAVSHHTYGAIQLKDRSAAAEQRVPTYRHGGHSTSTVFLHEAAFRNVEVKYMADLIGRNMTKQLPETAESVSKCAPFKHEMR
jgi:hypothetical protein